LVLIHGWACDVSFWRLQIPELSRGFRVLAIDLPGHGRSDKPQITYDGPLFTRAVLAVMDAERVQRSVLIGHSMGTEIAGRLLHDVPDRVLALVSLDGVIIRDWTEAGLKEVKDWGASMRGPSGIEVRGKFIEGLFYTRNAAGIADRDCHPDDGHSSARGGKRHGERAPLGLSIADPKAGACH
jgi:pimeloyl-ACP methyl ester carboxylesterase